MPFLRAIAVRGRLAFLAVLCASFSIVYGFVGLWKAANLSNSQTEIALVASGVAVLLFLRLAVAPRISGRLEAEAKYSSPSDSGATEIAQKTIRAEKQRFVTTEPYGFKPGAEDKHFNHSAYRPIAPEQAPAPKGGSKQDASSREAVLAALAPFALPKDDV